MRTLTKLALGSGIIAAMGSGIYGLNQLELNYNKRHAEDSVYPRAVQYEDVQVVRTVEDGDGYRSVLITAPSLKYKDCSEFGHFPFIRADAQRGGSFDTIRLVEVPKGSPLEKYANRDKLEEAYSALDKANRGKK